MVRVDYKTAYAMPSTQCKQLLKKQISEAVNERCLYLQTYFTGVTDNGKHYDGQYVQACDMLNLTACNFSSMLRRSLSFNVTIERIVPLSYFMMDEVLDCGRTSIQECWCGNAPDFDAPRAVDLFAHLYSMADQPIRTDVIQYIREHRRNTMSFSYYNEEMYSTVVLETFQTRTKEMWEENPFCRKNLGQSFVPVCYLNMFRELISGKRDVKDIHPKIRNQRVKQLLIYASVLAPIDYFLIPDYANYLLPYMIFHRPDGTPYRILDHKKFRTDRTKEILCQFASLSPEDQDVVLKKMLQQ